MVINEMTSQPRRRWLKDLFLNITDQLNRPQSERTIAKHAWLLQHSRGWGKMERASPFVLQCFRVLIVPGAALPGHPGVEKLGSHYKKC